MEYGPRQAAPAGLACLVRERLVPSIRRWWDRLHGWPWRPHIDVSRVDRHERRWIARILREAVRRRCESLRAELPWCLSILVDDTIAADESVVACLETLGDPDRPAWYIIRLALTRWGASRPLDAVVADLNRLLLAVLASYWGWHRETLVTAEPAPAPSFARHRPRPAVNGFFPEADFDGDYDVLQPRRHRNRSRNRR